MGRSTLAVIDSPAWATGVVDAGFEQVDQGNGDLFAIEDDTYLYVINGEAVAIDVILNLPATRHTADAIALKTITLQAGKMGVFGPFPVAAYKQPTDEKAWVDYSVAATILSTAAVIHGNKTPGL